MNAKITHRWGPLLVIALAVFGGGFACSSEEQGEAEGLRDGAVRITSRESIAVDVAADSPIKLGKNALAVTFPSRPGVELVSVSGLMPAHGHGTHPPTIARSGERSYRVDDLVLYMAGRWEVRFALRVDGHDDEALFTVDVR